MRPDRGSPAHLSNSPPPSARRLRPGPRCVGVLVCGRGSSDDDLKEHSSPLGRYASVDEKYHHHLSAEELPCVCGSVGWPRG